VFLFIGVSNNDDHVEIVRYVAEHGILPRIDEFNQAYHPPLYYVIAAAVLKMSGSVKTVHFLSLLFSIAGLSLAWHLVNQLSGLTAQARFWALMLVSFHPQFIIYSLFISNDSLANLLGLVVLAVGYRYLRHAALRNLVMLGVTLGLALATKFTFLAFILPIALVVLIVNYRQGVTLRRTVAGLAVLALIVVVLGSYKFVANARVTGTPFASNLDVWPWAQKQKPTWIGPTTILDFNLMKLVRKPTVSEETVHSYPLMLYASFWYQFIPDSTFRSNTKRGLNVLGSIIYLCAIWPTIMMIIGFGVIVKRSHRILSRRTSDWTATEAEEGLKLLAVLVLLMSIALIFSVGWRHDVYSVFNSRLVFPAYFGFLVCLASGIDWSSQRWPRAQSANVAVLRVLHAVFLVYIALDLSIAIVRPVDPLRTMHLPYSINMVGSSRR
jgi:4-amino-4-deoxy-L-arabinose transferase-like glycosyltransferase